MVSESIIWRIFKVNPVCGEKEYLIPTYWQRCVAIEKGAGKGKPQLTVRSTLIRMMFCKIMILEICLLKNIMKFAS
jgi:hypothetical protein